MKLSVDRGRCQGNALCAAIASNVFDLDDDEKAFVTAETVPDGEQVRVRRAISSCPEQAITLTSS